MMILRDPVERAVSQLFHMNELKYLRERRDESEKLGAKYIHMKVAQQVDRLSTCFREYGPKGCVYLTTAKENNMGTWKCGKSCDWIKSSDFERRREQNLTLNKIRERTNLADNKISQTTKSCR